jgi:beta-mannosidase
MARARLIGSQAVRPLGGTWSIAAVAPGRAQSPAGLETLALDWIPCEGPMPAAAALRAAGRWDLEHPRDFDAEEWWYRCRFATPDPGPRTRLRFEGLATVADVWLNGTHILRSESMFVAHAIDVGGVLRAGNELVLRFHALGPLLTVRRPRPRWRTGLVAHQQLRWHRTSLLGRIPAWCPPVAPVGPWRPVLLEPGCPLRIEQADVRAVLDGDAGVARVSVRASVGVSPAASRALHDALHKATLIVGECMTAMAHERVAPGEVVLDAAVRVPRVERWWPHTHGPQPLYPVRLSLEMDGGTVDVDLGRVGFRALEVERGADGEGFGLVVNGVRIFCRGACWTTLDVARLGADPAGYRSALEPLRGAGLNMLRVGGTMAYETDAFHDLCDELGILVWQDFMFASMDYPRDEAFARAVTLEARQVLEGLQGRPSLAVVCGNSEVEQQAAMLGLPAERWTNPLFSELLPALVNSLAPGVAWLPSTPTGGALPFHADRGVTHYYGVGAYRRPLDDARRAGVRFAAECLAFSNVPDPGMADRVLGEEQAPGQHPRWKARVPRDAGADWDFEDVRDHYVERLFGVETAGLRAYDPERYLALGRVATGEVMLRTFAEWRRPESTCRGGLVWFARDLWPGAGWGVIDSDGRPKAAFWYLKRVLAPVALLAADEGLNGLWFHAVNDTPDPIEAELRVSRYGEGRMRGASGTTALTIPARGARSVHADTLFEGFVDLTYAYRFGPPGHDVVAATLRRQATGAFLAAAHCFPCGLPSARETALGLAAHAEPIAGGYALSLVVDRFAHAVAVEAEGFVPDDNYLHLEPGEPRRLVLRAEVPDRPLRGSVSALNGPGAVPIACAVASAGD